VRPVPADRAQTAEGTNAPPLPHRGWLDGRGAQAPSSGIMTQRYGPAPSETPPRFRMESVLHRSPPSPPRRPRPSRPDVARRALSRKPECRRWLGTASPTARLPRRVNGSTGQRVNRSSTPRTGVSIHPCSANQRIRGGSAAAPRPPGWGRPRPPRARFGVRSSSSGPPPGVRRPSRRPLAPHAPASRAPLGNVEPPPRRHDRHHGGGSESARVRAQALRQRASGLRGGE